MAYSSIVIWKNPYTGQNANTGQYSVSYTKVITDIPTLDKTHDYWVTNPVANFGPSLDISFFSAIHYTRYSLKAYANGVEVPVIEGTQQRNETFKINSDDINGTYVHISYIPYDDIYYIGDTVDKLYQLFTIKSSVKQNINVRSFVHNSRFYINYIKSFLDLEPPLWVGGIGNMENNVYNNIISSLTPTSIELHLQEINDNISEIIYNLPDSIKSLCLFPDGPEYSSSYIESVQRSITSIDSALLGSGL